MVKIIQKQKDNTNIYLKYIKLLNQNKNLKASNKRIKVNSKKRLTVLNKKIAKLSATNKRLTSSNKRLQKNLKTQSVINYQKNYKYCPKNIYSNYDRIQYQRKLKKLNSRTFDIKKLKNMLNNLNSSKTIKTNNPNKHVNKIINIRIGEKVDVLKFLIGVKNSINNINKTWPNGKIGLLKSELNKINYSDFNFDNPLSNLKRDIFLDLLLIPSNDFKKSNNDIKILGIKNCAEISLHTGIKFIDPNLQKEIIFNKDFIKSKINKNIGILNAFYKMLQKFTDIKHLELYELINKINRMIDSTCIYFCDMPNNTCGLTISNGDIYIAGDYLCEALGETEEYKNLKTRNSQIYYKFKAICKIYLTLLHEFSHKLHYLIRKKQSKNDEWKDNFFDHSEEINSDNKLIYFKDLSGSKSLQTKNDYKNLHKNNIIDESGDFFDRELYLGIPFSGVDNKISKYFLCNRCDEYKTYIKNLNDLKNSFNQKSNRSSVSKFKIADDSSKCHFSIMRNS